MNYVKQYLFTLKFLQSKYLSDRLITSAKNIVPVPHACPQSLSPLADSRVNDSLLQIIPHFNEALFQPSTLLTRHLGRPMYTLLHDSPDLVVDMVQIWTVWQPEVMTDEVRCLPLQQLDGVAVGAMCRSGVCVQCRLTHIWAGDHDELFCEFQFHVRSHESIGTFWLTTGSLTFSVFSLTRTLPGCRSIVPVLRIFFNRVSVLPHFEHILWACLTDTWNERTYV